MTDSCTITYTEKQKHWAEVYRLWADWKYYDAADRGYDARACSTALTKLYRAEAFYLAWWGEKWSDHGFAVPLHN